ncbi:hypothetical protein BH10PSE12_BH10PSE12_12490 [soil metagenome]
MTRLEKSGKVLAVAKLANVGITMIWGFAVTYVFVRALPLHEFQAFLLLVAFGNFTVSAEFGVTSIAYARLRRYWLDHRGAGEGDDFRLEEIGFLFCLLAGLVLVAGMILGVAMLAGFVRVGMPLLFFLYFLAACINLPVLLVKRSLAATDHNLFWESLDLVRRSLTLALLLAVLLGFNLTLSVALQLLLSLSAIAIAGARLHRRLEMRGMHWIALRTGGRHVRVKYMRDMGSSVALNLSEIIAYNAPYFTIALATRDARPMLLFDFAYKMSRALTMVVRATVEAALPALTSAYYARANARFRALMLRTLAVAAVAALGGGTALAIVGEPLVRELYDGKLHIGLAEIGLIALLMLTLSTICVSVFLQCAVGRFSVVLRQSLPFLAGSLLSVPLAMALAPMLGLSFAATFLGLYALVFAGTAALHGLSLHRLLLGLRVAS